VGSADGAVALEIPAGALKSDVTVRIAEAPSSVLPAAVLRDNDVGKVYRFEPDGTRFEEPVRITMRVAGSPAVGGNLEAPVMLLASRSSGTIELLSVQRQTVDAATGDVLLSGEVTHFSEYWVNIPRALGITVSYSGLPETAWTVGPTFTAKVVVNQSADSPASAPAVHYISQGQGAAGGKGAKSIGTLAAGKAQQLTGTQEHYCYGSGQAEWVGVVNFTLIRETGRDDPEGVPLRSTYFTSGVRHPFTCTGGQPVGPPPPALALPGKYPTIVPTPDLGVPQLDLRERDGVEVPPKVKLIQSTLRAPVTTYTVDAEDPVDAYPPPPPRLGAGGLPLVLDRDLRMGPDGEELRVVPMRYFWTMVSTTEQCGSPKVEWTQEGKSVTWSHDTRPPDSCPHIGTDHAVKVQLVITKGTVPRLVCLLEGSETHPYGPEACTEVPLVREGTSHKVR
jgi:hypothetical protein